MIFATAVPFIFTVTFLIVVIAALVLLAVVALVIVPIIFLGKKPVNRGNNRVNIENHTVELTDDLREKFAYIIVNSNELTFTANPGTTNTRVAVCYTKGSRRKIDYYTLNFTNNESLKVVIPANSTFGYVAIVDQNGLDKNHQPVEKVKTSSLWIYSISCGVALAASIILIVVYLSTYLRKYQSGYILFYFIAAIGLILIPAIFFLYRFFLKRSEKGGK